MLGSPVKRKSHQIIYLNYLPRIVGYFLIGIILSSSFYIRNDIWVWANIISYSLFWPHIAFYFGLKNRNVKQAVFINFAIEAFWGGLWIAFLSFSLWPTLAIVSAGFANNLSTGGKRLLIKILPLAFTGALLGSYIFGVSFNPDSSLVTGILSFLFIVIYTSLISHATYTNAKRLNNSKKLLNRANQDIEEKFESAKQEILDRKWVEQELLKVNKDLQSFAYVVSHDLKAPLRGMSSLIHFIREDLSEESKELTIDNLDLIEGRVQRLDNLITGILEYSKIQKGLKSNSKINVKKLVENITTDLDIPNNLELSLLMDETLILNFNETYLYEIFSNLINNSLKYNNKAKPILKIGYESKDSFHCFYVEDNGMGVPDKFKYKIFEMFQKMHGRDEIEGSGIGLAIVKRILNQNGGDIWVESIPDKSTSFRFTLPKMD